MADLNLIKGATANDVDGRLFVMFLSSCLEEPVRWENADIREELDLIGVSMST